MFNGGFDQNTGPTALKVSSSEYTNLNDQNDKSSSDLNTSMEKKGSNSKTKKSKNKKKKATSSKSNLETNINLNKPGGNIHNRALDNMM